MTLGVIFMSLSYPTPHIDASPSDFAKTVIMPGDPLRSKYIAENFLVGAKLVNNIRGVNGYTGEYEGARISVMASGMGMPSMGIYSYELFNIFNVENIIRTGSCGAINESVGIMDIILSMSACTNSAYAKSFSLPGDFAPTADYRLLALCKAEADKMELKTRVGSVLTTDTFYADESLKPWSDMGVLAVEMETAALYMNAARAGKRALSVLTVSDSLVTGEALSAKCRQNSFTDMITLALNTAKRLADLIKYTQ